MKNIIFFCFLISTLSFFAFIGTDVHTDVYKVDPKLSTLEWYAEKIGGKHNGTIMFSAGVIKDNHGHVYGNFDIDMTSIQNTDLKSPEYNAKLVNHLKSDDFFNVEKFPKASFKIISMIPINAANKEGHTHTATGALTIRDKTNEISFKVKLDIDGRKAVCEGSAIVDRSKFDVKYGSKSFFENIGDKMIYDEFTMKFKVVATK